MEVNSNFRNDLTVSYLDRLVSVGNADEFMKFFPSVESYIKELVDSSKDLEILNKVKNIIVFRTSMLERKF